MEFLKFFCFDIWISYILFFLKEESINPLYLVQIVVKVLELFGDVLDFLPSSQKDENIIFNRLSLVDLLKLGGKIFETKKKLLIQDLT